MLIYQQYIAILAEKSCTVNKKEANYLKDTKVYDILLGKVKLSH